MRTQNSGKHKIAQVRTPGTVPVSGPGLRFSNCETTPDRGSSEQSIVRPPRTGVLGAEQLRDRGGHRTTSFFFFAKIMIFLDF